MKTEGIQIYKDLCGEINILDERISDLERELRHLFKLMSVNEPKMPGAIDYTLDRVTNSRYVPSLDDLIPRVNEINKMLERLYEVSKAKERTKSKIEKTLSEFEGLEYKVAYMRTQGKSLKVIAVELGYSYDYIREVSSRTNNPHNTHRQADKSVL